MSRYFFLVDVDFCQPEGLEKRVSDQVEEKNVELLRRYAPILQHRFEQKSHWIEWDLAHGGSHNISIGRGPQTVHVMGAIDGTNGAEQNGNNVGSAAAGRTGAIRRHYGESGACLASRM